MNLEEAKERISHWLSEMKHGYRGEQIESAMVTKGDRLIIVIYTTVNEYQIVASVDSEKTYLGATASSRTPRAGEDWTRGNDLADGEFSKETWHKILADIVGYELVKIQRPIKELERLNKQSGLAL